MQGSGLTSATRELLAQRIGERRLSRGDRSRDGDDQSARAGRPAWLVGDEIQ
jgi:hypothetical protein